MHAMSSLSHITSHQHTPEQVSSHSEQMWLAVDKTLELDCIVDEGEMCVHVDECIMNNHMYSEVFKCVISEYVSARLNIQ